MKVFIIRHENGKLYYSELEGKHKYTDSPVDCLKIPDGSFAMHKAIVLTALTKENHFIEVLDTYNPVDPPLILANKRIAELNTANDILVGVGKALQARIEHLEDHTEKCGINTPPYNEKSNISKALKQTEKG